MRLIKRAEVFEVSPVLVGAGVGTYTLGIKGLSIRRSPTRSTRCWLPWPIWRSLQGAGSLAGERGPGVE